jgi:hypothetical protein
VVASSGRSGHIFSTLAFSEARVAHFLISKKGILVFSRDEEENLGGLKKYLSFSIMDNTCL